jgi:internalin A
MFLAIGIALSGGSAIADRAKQEENFNSFTDWCVNRDDISSEAQKTVEALLEVAGTDNCNDANKKLSSLTELNLRDRGLSDLRPLSSFTNLRNLMLLKNKIEDISPLANLTNLTQLNLAGNDIRDITPLSGLTQLRELFLMTNEITDIRSLANLSNLTRLWVTGNPIANKTCPVSPASVCFF